MYITFYSNQETPFIRIKRIELDNFKGVRHGVLELNCSSEYVPYNTRSDILGLYGQNGSGKTSIVQAIEIVKDIMSGYPLGSEYAKCVDVNEECAWIKIEFEFQYSDDLIATVEYQTKLEVKEKMSESSGSEHGQEKALVLSVSDEVIKTNLYDDGTIGRKHTVIDTGNGHLLCAKALEKYFFDDTDNKQRDELSALKKEIYEESRSFIFSHEASEIFNEKNTDESVSIYYGIMASLYFYATHLLFISNTRTNGLVQLRVAIPIHVPFQARVLILDKNTIIKKKYYVVVEAAFSSINTVLATLIPDLQLVLRKTEVTAQNGEEGYAVEILSKRGDRIFPIEYEADGIIKIVSLLASYTFAFNEGSATLVVDEFDSGIFEFLLGELLQIFERAGIGQLIFTSHNLRPLEVLDRKFIRFTTSDPENRYYKLKNVGGKGNLRDLYLREIQLGNGDVEIYHRTKSFKIEKALIASREEMMFIAE